MTRKGKYLVVDTETTGLDPHNHILIQLAAAVLDEKMNIIETFCVDVKGEGDFPFSTEALDVTGFSLKRIENGEEPEKVCDDFILFIKNNFENKPIMVGQFYPFDFAVINSFFGKCGKSEEWLSLTGNEFIDTKALVLTANLQAELREEKLPFPVTSLSKPGGLKEKFGFEEFQAHDALGDVLATREVLIRLLDYLDIKPRN